MIYHLDSVIDTKCNPNLPCTATRLYPLCGINDRIETTFH